MTRDDFKIPILLRLMERQGTVVNDLLKQASLKINEVNYDKNANLPPRKWFTLELK
jgi:hypothetical protein